MSVTPSTLSAIQQAGQAIDLARQSLSEAVKAHAQQVMAAVADQPFSVDNDKLFANWKTLARLAQEVHSIEEQFKTLYQTASGLAAPETPVLKALPQSGRHKTTGQAETYTLDTANAEDIQIKPATAKKVRRRAGARAGRKPAVRATAAAAPSGSLSANDTKALDYLKTVLNRQRWTRVTQSDMAHGAGIPKGSIGLALRRLIAAARVLEGAKGSYKLA